MAESTPAMRKTLEANPRGQERKEATAKSTPETPAPVAEEPKADTPEAEAAAEETPEADAPDKPEDEVEVETEDDDGGEGPVSPITGKRTHLRLPQDDKVGRLAAALMRRNRDMSMTEAVERANNQLGIKPKDATTDEPAAPKSDLPDSVEATQAAISDLRAKRKAANASLNFEEVSDLSDKLEDLIQHRFNLERNAEKQEVAAASAYDQRFTASESRATELYAFAGDPESDGAKRMLEIEADLKANEDPLYNSPDKPLRIAQMVAAELKIAPRKKGAPAAPAKAAAPANGVPVPKKQMLPAGGSRTTPPPVNQKPAIITQAEAATNPAQWRKVRQQLGLSH